MVVAEKLNPTVVERVLPALIVREARIALFASSVTVKPPSIVTTSPAPGTEKPGTPPEVSDQVAVEFQGPVATEKRLAALASNPIPTTKTNKAIASFQEFFATVVVKRVFKLLLFGLSYPLN